MNLAALQPAPRVPRRWPWAVGGLLLALVAATWAWAGEAPAPELWEQRRVGSLVRLVDHEQHVVCYATTASFGALGTVSCVPATH